MKRLILLIFLCAVITGCGPTPPDAPSRSTSTPAPLPVTPTHLPIETVKLVGVRLSVADDPSTRPELVEGSEIHVIARFAPSVVSVQRLEDGSIYTSSWTDWENAPVKAMRLCFSVTGPCQPQGDWQPFAPQAVFRLAVDWLGPNNLFLAAEFRDDSGAIVPASSFFEIDPQPQAQVILATVAAAGPEGAGSSAALTAIAITRAAFPVSGGVTIEDGGCCAGGEAGSPIALSVDFVAESPAGLVNEMRVLAGGNCQGEAAGLDAPWEPFAPHKTYLTTLALNWTSYTINVQYRDQDGNLSPVYCDEISLEGAPANTP